MLDRSGGGGTMRGVRIRIDLAYDGTDFHGWATQPGLRTVQATLEQALETALRLPRVRVFCAGRTDTGVHARGQVVHLDVEPELLLAAAGRSSQPPLVELVRRLNGILTPDVRVWSASEAPEGFDARFSATWRRYAYRVVDRTDLVDPLLRGHVLPWPRPLDVDALNEASAPLLGLHDFAAFCRRRPGATTVRSLTELTWDRDAGGLVVARVVADAFCHSMVRALVGCLLAVGEGQRDTRWAVDVLAGRTRHPAVRVAQARGLTLEEVGYPADHEMAAQAEQARARREELA